MPRSDSTPQIPNPRFTTDLQSAQKILFYEPEYQNFQRHSLFRILINDIDFLTYFLSVDFRSEFLKNLRNDPTKAINDPDFRNAMRGKRLELILPAKDQLYAYNCYNNFYNKNTADSINAINRDRIIPLQNQIRNLQNQITPWQNQINFLNSKLSTDLANLNNMHSNNQIPEPSGNILASCPKPTNAPVSSPSSPLGGTTDMRPRNFATRYPISF